MRWHRHRWSKWSEPFDVPYTEYAITAFSNRTIGQGVRVCQRRTCEKCGQIEQRRLS